MTSENSTGKIEITGFWLKTIGLMTDSISVTCHSRRLTQSFLGMTLLQRITCQSNDQGVDSLLQTCYRNPFNTGMALGSSFLSNNLLTTPKGVLGPHI